MIPVSASAFTGSSKTRRGKKSFTVIIRLNPITSPTPPKAKDAGAVPGKTAAGIELTGKASKQEDEVTALLNSYRRRLSMALN